MKEGICTFDWSPDIKVNVIIAYCLLKRADIPKRYILFKHFFQTYFRDNEKYKNERDELTLRFFY